MTIKLRSFVLDNCANFIGGRCIDGKHCKILAGVSCQYYTQCLAPLLEHPDIASLYTEKKRGRKKEKKVLEC